MAQDEDYAIIIGVQKYPGLMDLEGPENDAQAFREWVVAITGGNVPSEGLGGVGKADWTGNVRTILSSQYSPFNRLDEARPFLKDIQQAFLDLDDLAEANAQRLRAGRVAGRRLYIYMAGHGIEPQNSKTALLTAEVKEKRFGFHVLGRDYADYFSNAGIFKEVILFMDCCRDYFPMTPLTPIPFDTISDPKAPDRMMYLHGFATRWKRRSRERLIGDKVRGVFTAALLKGLHGGASDSSHRITASSLRNYLNESMQHFLAAADLADATVPKQPEFTQFPSEGEGMVIIEDISPPSFDVTIALSDLSEGQRIQILGPGFSFAAGTIAHGRSWELKLPRGLYLAQLLPTGRQKDFEVSGVGGIVHVQL